MSSSVPLPSDGSSGRRVPATPPRIAVLAVGLPTLLATVVGLWSLTVPSLWRDESVSVHVARGSLSEAWRLWHDVDAVHATYDVVLRAFVWIEPVELGARLPSLIGFAVATAGVVLLGRRLAGWSTGVTAGCVYAVLPFAVRYAQEARSYALVSAVAVLATLALLRACERPTTGRVTVYAALVVLLGHLHLYALPLVLAHGLHVLRTDRAVLRRVGLAWVAAAVMIVPLAVVGASQRDRQLSWLRSPGPGQLVDLVHGVGGTWGAVGVLGVAVAAGCWYLRDRPVVALWAFVPVVASFTISQVHPVYADRYLLFVVPALALLAGAGIDGLARRLGPARVVPVSIAVVGLLAVLTLPVQREIRTPDGRPDDLRSMSRALGADLRPGDGLVLLPASYLPFVDAYADPFQRLAVVDAARVPAGVERVWVVSRRAPTEARHAPALDRLAQDFRRTAGRSYGYTHLSLWQRR